MNRLPKGRLACLAVSAIVLTMAFGVLHAQSTPAEGPEDQYRKLIRVNEDIQPLGEDPFGEAVSLYTGSLSFSQTDVSLSGNGPVLQVVRSFHVKSPSEIPSISDGAFGDWDLELPRITTMTANQQGVSGWQVGSPGNNARCSSFSPPPTVPLQQGGADWAPSAWWSGYQLVVPGQGSQDLLRRSPANSNAPQSGGTSGYPIVTKDNWMIRCLATTDGSDVGEAFSALAPDGTKYTFNHMVYRWAPNTERPIGSGPLASRLPPLHADPRLAIASNVDMLPKALHRLMAALPSVLDTDFLRRRQASLFVTHVEDRFGNTVDYAYDGNNITSITASDGRKIQFAYIAGTSQISSVTVSGPAGSSRTWTYQYNQSVGSRVILTGVTQPDGSTWSLNLAPLDNAQLDGTTGNCDLPGGVTTDTWSGSMTHPSGLQGTFVVKGLVRGRSYVPKSCVYYQDNQSSSAFYPVSYSNFALASKTFSGAGLSSSQIWSYSYSSPNGSWTTDACASTASCATTVWTDVTDPAGKAVRYTFSNHFDITEGQLLRVDHYDGAAGSSLVRSQINQYATTGSWPSTYGDSQQTRTNSSILNKGAPLNQRQTIQDGDTYTWQAESFNTYAQVTKQKRFNSIANQPTLEESLGYLNDTNLWVLGLPTTVTNVATGEVESQNVYDTSKDTLSQRWRFGQQLMSYTFDSAGNLASFTDGNNHTTTLGSYKRGIPQAIGYPDGTSESLAVDDFGQISSLTDQAGKTTSYAYDGVGRLTRITYPTGDSVAWAPKVFTYAYVTSAERGIGANHWRRTATQGGAQSVTYFDAELRPVLSDSYDGSAHTTARTDYDWRGQKTFASYPRDGALSLSSLTTGTATHYDALGRITQTQQNSELGTLTSSTAYLSGARVQVTDPKGKVTTTTYQVFDQPSYDNAVLVQAPAGIHQAISRDVYGNPQSIRQYGSYNNLTSDLTKYLYYDSYHRLCRTAEPESGSTVMHYDAANNVDWTADGLSLSGSACSQESVAAAAKTTRTYDAMNRVKTLVPPSGTQSTQYTYDARGNVQTAVSGISTWSSTRNGLGLLTSETLQLTGQNAWTLGYGYDANGSLASITYPDGSAVNYAPDALGRPTQAGGYANSVSYFPNGEVKAFTFGNGELYSANQTTRNLLSDFSYAKDASHIHVSEAYTYDANANITGVNDLAGGPRTKAFGYDDLNRLTSATATSLWGSQSYTYDPLNNIASRSTGGTSVVYNYNGLNQLTGLSDGTTFAYDSRGNVINKNGVALTFDAKNQLMDAGSSVSYAYDASGRRVSKMPTGGSPTYYFYSQAGQLMYQREPDSYKATDYIYLGKRMIARNEIDTRKLTAADVNVTLTLVSGPTLSADGTKLSTTIDIANHGDVTLSSSGTYPVHLGDHIVNAGGTVLVNDLDRSDIPDIAAGQHAAVSITTPVNSILGTGNRLQFVPVQEGVAWFTSFGTTPITVGSFVTPTVPSSSANGSYTVSWTGLGGATSYTLQEQVNGGSWATIQATSATSKAVSGKTNGTYGYRVEACASGGCGPFSVTASTSVLLPPATPGSISVPGTSSGSVAVNWATSSTATSYTLQQRLGSGSWSTVYTGTATSSTRSITATGSYSFQVRACNTSGCSGWKASSAVAVTIPPASAPSLSVPSSSTTGSYTVSWGGVSGATSYTLQEQTNGGGWGTIQSSSATSRAISGKGNGTYGYRVQACNAGGCSNWSATGSMTVALIPVQPAAPHAGYTGTTYKPTVTVTWTAVANATSYKLEQTDPQNGTDVVYTGSAASWTQFVIASGNVTYRVAACSSAGCSPYSSNSNVLTLSSGAGGF